MYGTPDTALGRRRDEGRLLDRVDEVVPGPPDHAQALTNITRVAHHLLEREARPDVPDAGEPRNPVDPAVRDRHVLALVERQDVHLVAAGARGTRAPSARPAACPAPERTGAGPGPESSPAARGPHVEPSGCRRRMTSAISASSRAGLQPRSAAAIRAAAATVPRVGRSSELEGVRRRTTSESRTAISSRIARSIRVPQRAVDAILRAIDPDLRRPAGDPCRVPGWPSRRSTTPSATPLAVVNLTPSTDNIPRCPPAAPWS